MFINKEKIYHVWEPIKNIYKVKTIIILGKHLVLGHDGYFITIKVN